MEQYELEQSHAHCVFRRGSSWFAFPALSVREVMPCPKIITVPHCSDVLRGLCQVRSEYLPVLSLTALLPDHSAGSDMESQLLIVFGSDGPWALLVDRVEALLSLETSLSPDAYGEDLWECAVMGWASYGDQILRVLDPMRFYKMAERVLDDGWLVGSYVSNQIEQLNGTTSVEHSQV